MSFFSLIARNVLRQRIRTLLTVLGIGIGVMTVIALGAITSGLKASTGEMTRAGGADLMVGQKGAADLSLSALPASAEETVANVDGVAATWGDLLHIARVGSNPFFVLHGVEPAKLRLTDLDTSSGRLPESSGELMLGQRAADELGVGVGGTVEIDRRPFTVVGIHTAEGVWQRAGGYAPLADVQALARKADVLTVVYVKAEKGVEVPDLSERIESASDMLAAISTPEDYAEVDQGMQALDAGNLAISMLAILIGAIGVMNTMIMSVFERTREIGVLRAVGWGTSRVVRMIVGEALLLCLVAALFGIAAGLLVSRAVTLIPAIGSFLEPSYPATLFGRALLIAFGVAVAGALYPAIRAIRLSPMEALRHE